MVRTRRTAPFVAELFASYVAPSPVTGIAAELLPGKRLIVRASGAGGETSFDARVHIDTAVELDYYRHGGILQFVLRQLLKSN